MRLDDLGDRICVIGQAGSGKSTLAVAIGRTHGLPVVHLDRLRHRAGTQWELRPDDEFAELHDAAIVDDRWIIEGTYSSLMPQRLARATGLIVLELSTMQSLLRYLRRTSGHGARFGGLEGTRDSLSWDMIRYILARTRTNRRQYRRLFDQLDLPKIRLTGFRSVADFYLREGLERPS